VPSQLTGQWSSGTGACPRAGHRGSSLSQNSPPEHSPLVKLVFTPVVLTTIAEVLTVPVHLCGAVGHTQLQCHASSLVGMCHLYAWSCRVAA
jgi:hypothetical protein